MTTSIYKVSVPVKEIEEFSKLVTSFKHIQSIANHYNIYKDLFEQGYFKPSVDLNIEYKTSDNKSYNVYFGNKISANYVNINKLKIDKLWL
jgi:large subunit ribosomal protein L38